MRSRLASSRLVGAVAMLLSLAPTGAAFAQDAEPRAVDAARCTFDATAVLGAPSTSAAFSRDGSLLALYAATGMALVRSEDCSVVATTTQTIEADGVVYSYPVQLIVTDAQRVVAVTVNDGVWAWAPTEPTVRRVMEGATTGIATHAGGEHVILEVDIGTGAGLVRLNVANGRITHRRTLPTGEVRGLENLGWDVGDGSLLALTDEGRLFSLRASTLGRPTERRSYRSGSERRLAVLTAEGELAGEVLYERLYEGPAQFWVAAVSADGRVALLESFLRYPPSPAPRRWMTWTPGTTLPMSISGPVADDAHHAAAISSTGRTLVCAPAPAWTPTPAPATAQPCWLVDL